MKRLSRFVAFISLLFLASPAIAFAVPAAPVSHLGTQPDGSTFTYRVRGDEYFSYTVDEAGSLIQRDAETGEWRYVTGSGSDMGLGGAVRADDSGPSLFSVSAGYEGTLLSDAERSAYAELAGGSYMARPAASFPLLSLDALASKRSASTSARSRADGPASIPVVVIVVGFNDEPYQDEYDWHERFFTGEYSIGSFYTEASQGAFTFVPAHETSQSGADDNTNNRDAANDGIIHVKLDRDHGDWGDFGINSPDGLNNDLLLDSMKTSALALEAATAYFDLASYDANGDGAISNDELAVIFINAGQDSAFSYSSEQGTWPVAHSALTAADGVAADGIYLEGFIQMAEYYDYSYMADAEGNPQEGILQAGNGTACHELGHYIGLPDLYDTTYTPSGEDAPWAGLEPSMYSLMSNGSWGTRYDLGTYRPDNESIPARLDPYCRMRLGYLELTPIAESGSYTLPGMDAAAGGYVAYRIDTDNPDEFFIVENRPFTGFDSGIEPFGYGYGGNGGIVVWHIDEEICRNYGFDSLEVNGVNVPTHRPGVTPCYYEQPLDDNGAVRPLQTASLSSYTARVAQEQGYELTYWRYGGDTPAERVDSGIWVTPDAEPAETVTVEISLPEPEPVPTSLSIMHTNDIHGYHARTDSGAIGYSALAALADEMDPDLLLDAGDTFHGQSFATVMKGDSILALMNQAGYDAMTIGNHDWSYGASRLASLANLSAGQDGVEILAANVLGQDGGPLLAASSVKEIETAEGMTLKVGIVGAYDEALADTIPVAMREGTVIEPAAAAASSEAARLRREEGCDIVVVLTHSTDPSGFAASLSGVDAVVAGHEHIEMDETVEAADGRQVPVVEAGCYFQDIGLLELELEPTVSEDGSVDWAVSGHTAALKKAADVANLSDPEMDKLVSSLEEQTTAALDQVIGTAKEDRPYGWESVRSEDTAIGSLVTAAYLEATGADVAFENAGGIRAGIGAGEVTAGDVLAVSPYGNTLATYEMSGRGLLSIVERMLELRRACNEAWAQQKDAAEAGMSYEEFSKKFPFPDGSGGVLAIGGVTMRIDMSKPEGERVLSAEIDGKPVDAAATYVVAMNSYVPQLTDVYPELANMTLKSDWGTCEEALRSFIGKEGWEARIDALVGTVTYVTDADAGPGDSGEQGQRPNVPKPAPGNLPNTGDSAPASVLVLAASGAAAVVAGAAIRKRAA